MLYNSANSRPYEIQTYALNIQIRARQTNLQGKIKQQKKLPNIKENAVKIDPIFVIEELVK